MQPTETFPVVQRTGIRFFRRVTRAFIDFFANQNPERLPHLRPLEAQAA